MSNGRRITKSEIYHPLSTPSHFTKLTEGGALELRNPVSPFRFSHLSILLLIQKKIRHYKINRKWQMTFIQTCYEEKIEYEDQNISGNENSLPPK